ncbi:hypothetical protein B7494_g6096 [Chlorociboria aeruginascens]|nr:hypothetical protein B7494_g6096 [Chlorociboria aeruginascens]
MLDLDLTYMVAWKNRAPEIKISFKREHAKSMQDTPKKPKHPLTQPRVYNTQSGVDDQIKPQNICFNRVVRHMVPEHDRLSRTLPLVVPLRSLEKLVIRSFKMVFLLPYQVYLPATTDSIEDARGSMPTTRPDISNAQ